MDRNSSSSSSSVSQKDLLKFYQKKYEEFQRNEDKYKEKVDRHLKNLVTDRHELEEEVLRRGEKIADLQKALVELQLSVFEERERFLQVSSENEKLKRNEVQLHDSIRQLLAMTHQQDLRDKIIYILKDPKVDVGYRTDISAKSRYFPEITANQKLKEELDNLKHQLDEVLKISKNKSDVVLEDCKEALEMSKAKIMQDEVRMKELQKMLQELKVLEKNKSSVAAAKNSSLDRQRSVQVGKSISDEKQNSLSSVRDALHDSSASFLERHRQTSSISSERQGISHKTLNSATAAKSISSERTTAKNTPHEALNSTAATKSTSAVRQTQATAAKSVSWENQLSVRTVQSISDENQSSAPRSADSGILSQLCSVLKDIHLSLILLAKVVSKVRNILNSIQATKLYHRTAMIPKAPTDMQYHVEENTVLQLETCLRQCTRLTFDIDNLYKSLCKQAILNKAKVQSTSGLKSELKYLEKIVKEMIVITADNDLLNVGLRRSDFFQALSDSSVVIPEENRVTYLEDFKKIINNNETLSETLSRACDFVESVIEKYTVKRDFHDIADSLRGYSYLSSDTQSFASSSDESVKQAKSQSLQDLEKLVGIYKRTVQDSKNVGLSTDKLSERIKAAERTLQEEERKKCEDDEGVRMQSGVEDILRKINKTLSKVEQMELGRWFKDEEMCQKLAENVTALTEQFKELNLEYNVKSVQDQFSEYTRVTLSKLEELAKQCKNSVIAAEAQIASHRSNAKNLSEKLKETEELLRESINECLSLKQKMKQTETEQEMQKYTLISALKEKLERRTTAEGVDDIIDELVSDFPAYDSIKSKPFVCMYCRQGTGHKYCEEKIKELTADCRKFKTMLKLQKREADEEKLTLKNHREVAESSITDLTKRNQSMKESLEALEKKNASLLEQLKLEKNRIKNMERFRRLEIEGFQTDIKQLKVKIRDLEKQLLKAIFIFENNHKDVELLKTVHETAQRSEQATAILKRLKAKLYQLENDLKSL